VKKGFGITLVIAILLMGLILVFVMNDRDESVKANEKGIKKISNQDKWKKSFKPISKAINFDLYDYILKIYNKEGISINLKTKIKNIKLKAVKTNLVHNGNKNNDYFIIADVVTDWDEDNATIVLAYEKFENRYKLIFKHCHSYGGKGFNCGLIDINSDYCKEITMEEDNSGNSYTKNMLSMYKYYKGKYVNIFYQGLSEAYYGIPYFYNNNYAFRKNKNKPWLKDLIFTINTDIDRNIDVNNDIYKNYKGNMAKPFKDIITYTFNGERYIPNKPVHDYREIIRKCYPDA
jgi:hypothetical protein